MFITKNYLTLLKNDKQDELNFEFKGIIKELFGIIFKDKKMFSSDNFTFYYYDEYALDTPTYLSPYATLYVEINQPNNIKQNVGNFQNKKKQNIFPELYLTLKEIKEALFETSVVNFDSNVLMWIDKFGVNYAINDYDKDDYKTTYYFRVIPCITYKNKNNVNGIMYCNDTQSLIEIEYPKLSIINFNNKSKQTNGLFKDYVVMFKNFYMKQKNEKNLPSEIFETLLYNVPNEFFENYSTESIYKVINYLRNLSIKDFMSIDEQDFAFTSPYKSFSIIYGNHVIKELEKFIKNVVK